MSKKANSEMAGVEMRWESPEMIEPHPMNPRTVVTEGPVWDAFLESIRSRGVLQPLLVRPLPGAEDGYQCVGGHRRLQAALVAELLRVPVIVRQMSDTEALEVLLVENLERSDLDPMEEAAGVQALVGSGAMSAEELARRIDRSEEWVQLRLDLPLLPAEAHQAVRTGQLSLGVAREVLRLPAEERERGVQLVLCPDWSAEPLSLAQARHELEERIWTPRRLQEWWTAAMGRLRQEWPMCDPIAPAELDAVLDTYQYPYGSTRHPWVRIDLRVRLHRRVETKPQVASPPATVVMEALGFRGVVVPDMAGTPMPGQERNVLPLVDFARLEEAASALIHSDDPPEWVDRVFSEWATAASGMEYYPAEDEEEDDESPREDVPPTPEAVALASKRAFVDWLKVANDALYEQLGSAEEREGLLEEVASMRSAWVAWVREGAERLGLAEGTDFPEPPKVVSGEG